MNKKSCEIALTFLDWQVVNPTTFTKASYNNRYYITFYKQPEINKYNQVSCILNTNVQNITKQTNEYFTNYNDIIEFVKTL